VVKIGASRSPQQRLRELQTSNPNELVLAAMVPGGYALEKNLHERFVAYRLYDEWFQLTQEIVDLIESINSSQSSK
jgi:enhancing lycopene biosynthesis protein 2